MGVLTQVTMERQHNDQWCWAAVTSSVFRALQNRQITQERVVVTTLGNASCSLQPTPPECNVPFLLDIVLPQTCECSVSVQGVLAFSELQSQIDGQRLQYNGNGYGRGGHPAGSGSYGSGRESYLLQASLRWLCAGRHLDRILR